MALDGGNAATSVAGYIVQKDKRHNTKGEESRGLRAPFFFGFDYQRSSAAGARSLPLDRVGAGRMGAADGFPCCSPGLRRGGFLYGRHGFG